MAATRQKVGDGISRTSAISRAPDTENRAFRHYGTSDERTAALRQKRSFLSAFGFGGKRNRPFEILPLDAVVHQSISPAPTRSAASSTPTSRLCWRCRGRMRWPWRVSKRLHSKW